MAVAVDPYSYWKLTREPARRWQQQREQQPSLLPRSLVVVFVIIISWVDESPGRRRILSCFLLLCPSPPSLLCSFCCLLLTVSLPRCSVAPLLPHSLSPLLPCPFLLSSLRSSLTSLLLSSLASLLLGSVVFPLPQLFLLCSVLLYSPTCCSLGPFGSLDTGSIRASIEKARGEKLDRGEISHTFFFRKRYQTSRHLVPGGRCCYGAAVYTRLVLPRHRIGWMAIQTN